ncbi:MAG: Hsp20/alpha crystallin family protein [Candidatus Jordarchaeum sp.]|uniref:Hsp20/alpha crystallin family protein n=1 Tax=Candidatus Jordarchaeum sp. TaxID=2823881 RepID=UPI004049FFE7
MVDDDKKRKRRNPFWDIFENFEQFQEIIEEMMRQLFKDPEKMFRNPEEFLKNPPPMFYGFSVTIGPDGKPQIKPLGKGETPFKPTIEIEQQKEEEPLVDIFDEGKEIIVVAEIPGVRKDDIKVDATKNTIYIWVNANMKKFNKEIPMPCKINPKTVESSYKNRVLEIRAQKA